MTLIPCIVSPRQASSLLNSNREFQDAKAYEISRYAGYQKFSRNFRRSWLRFLIKISINAKTWKRFLSFFFFFQNRNEESLSDNRVATKQEIHDRRRFATMICIGQYISGSTKSINYWRTARVEPRGLRRDYCRTIC